MNLQVLIKDGARSDISTAYQYYGEISPQLAEDFLDRIDESIERVRSGPEMYARVFGEIRQVKLRRFPFVISYLFEDNKIIVLAVLHGHRNPREWQDRS